MSRPPEGGRLITRIYCLDSCREPLPPIEAVIAGALTTTHGESDKPQDEKDCCGYPQDVHRESGSKENQNKQQRKNQYHRTSSLFTKTPIGSELVS
jgi:hypothetical protein